MIKAILFDLDGTLLDNKAALSRAFVHTVKKFGYENEKELSQVTGESATKAIRDLFPHLPREKQKEIEDYLKQRYYGFYLHALGKLVLDAEEALPLLKKKFALALVTNNEHKYLIALLDAFKINFFDVVVAKDDVACEKPCPDELLLALKKLNVSAEEAVFVGDSAIDVEAARNAGVKCFLVDQPGNAGLECERIFGFKELLKL